MRNLFLKGYLGLIALCAPISLAAQERWAIPEYRVVGAAASEADARALEALLEAYRSAWSAQDAEALAALHTSDTEWTNAFARIIQNREALETFLGERMFPGFSREVSEGEARSLTPISLRFLGDDTAIWHIYAESRRNGGRDDPSAARRVHFHFVVAKGSDDTWRIAHTAIFDARR